MRSVGCGVLLLILTVCLGSAAIALPFPPGVATDSYEIAQGGAGNGIPTAQDDNDTIPDINDAVNRILGTNYLRNKDVDHLFVEPDYIWQQLNGGGIALIGLTAGNNNTVGFYTDLGVGNNRTLLLGPYSGFGFVAAGTQLDPYPAAGINLVTGTLFGWYLYSDANQNTYYYSEPGIADSWDHMMTFSLPVDEDHRYIWIDHGEGPEQYQLNEPYLICWEDLPWDGNLLGDEDYDDMIYLVDMVKPIPEPSTWFMLGSGLLGLVAFGRRRSNSFRLRQRRTI